MTREEVVNELNYLIHDCPERIPEEARNGLKHALAYIDNEKAGSDNKTRHFDNKKEEST